MPDQQTAADYLQNSGSLIVHRTTCPSVQVRPIPGADLAWWFLPWTPEDRDRHDQPCRRCLPDGLPESGA